MKAITVPDSGGPEQAVNFAFGGPDLRTLFCCAHTSVYTLRLKVPGNPHPWYKRRGVERNGFAVGGRGIA
jgi:sugar lactone lactonase YvrE